MLKFTLRLTALLWILPALGLTTQELVDLKVIPRITTKCGVQVTLSCKATSSQDGLSIKHMEWAQNNTILCSVDSKGKITTHQTGTLSDFYCDYEAGRLSLVFREVLPVESGKEYRCKLRSNKGVHHEYTRLELQECSGNVTSVLTSDGPVCTFSQVYPGGEVHWFDHSHNFLHEQQTTESVDEHTWVNIRSFLQKWNSSHMPYNCSLKSTMSGRYITSGLVQWYRAPDQIRANANRVLPPETWLCVLILLVATMK